jgi:hypothetical protein
MLLAFQATRLILMIFDCQRHEGMTQPPHNAMFSCFASQEIACIFLENFKEQLNLVKLKTRQVRYIIKFDKYCQ